MKIFWALVFSASIASAQEIVNVDGRNVRIRVEGTGSPAVIFESGFGGDGLNSWAPIFPEIAKMTRAFASDRAGGLVFVDPMTEMLFRTTPKNPSRSRKR